MIKHFQNLFYSLQNYFSFLVIEAFYDIKYSKKKPKEFLRQDKEKTGQNI